jgi:cation:H+ antiporter
MTTATLVLQIVLVAAGMFLLYGGGNGLVKGAAGMALHFRIPPLVVGLTVVAFGTSAPELFVSLLSAIQGKMGVSVGNVVGSNVINVALILGISALAWPAVVDRGVIRIDVPFMLVTYLLFGLAAVDFGEEQFWLGGVLFRWEGMILVAVLVCYVFLLYRRSVRTGGAAPLLVENVPTDEADRPLWLDGLYVLAGISFLAVGAELLVRGASTLATDVFGASERFVGIAIVAFGTSLPELFTTIAGISRKEMDISVGNIVGSNIFNSLMVLGATAIVRPIEIGTTDFRGDFAFMVGTTALLLVFLLAGRKVPRWGGGVFLAVYAFYLVFLTLTRTI